MILINLQLPGSAKNLKNLFPWDLFKSPAICARAPSLPFPRFHEVGCVAEFLSRKLQLFSLVCSSVQLENHFKILACLQENVSQPKGKQMSRRKKQTTKRKKSEVNLVNRRILSRGGIHRYFNTLQTSVFNSSSLTFLRIF